VTETEQKYRLTGEAELDRLRARLALLRATHLGAHHEENFILDDRAGSIRDGGRVLRLRRLDGGPGGVLTYKGPADYTGGIKSRDEREVTVDDVDGAAAVFAGLGYRVALTYAKERDEWRLGGTTIALDRLIFGTFCEIEGPPADLPTLSAQLGLPSSQLELAGYPTLAAQHAASPDA
jgi:predicted adenylyl cyclase CyaB